MIFSEFISTYNDLAVGIKELFNNVKSDNGLEEYEYHGFFIKENNLIIIAIDHKNNSYGECSFNLDLFKE